jgi:thiosulfate reductase cytochrome b subunit
MLWANVVNALLGIWFIIAPSVLGTTGRAAEMWTSIAGGAVLLVLAGWAVLSERARTLAWVQYVNGLVGIWFIVAPFVLSVTAQPQEMWTSVVGGAIALVLAGYLAFRAIPGVATSR